MNSAFLDFPSERTEFSDASYSALGRALTYATVFEANCRSLSSLGHLKIRLPELLKTYPPGTDVLPMIVGEIWRKQLYPHIEKVLKNHGWGSKSDVAGLLTKAREARNEIAHAVALGLPANIETDVGQSEFLARISALVEEITVGLMIVEVTSLVETHEPCPAPDFFVDYSQRIVRWVTAP